MLSLTHQFLSWCRSKPADEEYDYANNCECAFAQFLVEHGMATKPNVGSVTWGDHGSSRPFHRHAIPGALSIALGCGERTFGSLAERVERQLAEQVTL